MISGDLDICHGHGDVVVGAVPGHTRAISDADLALAGITKMSVMKKVRWMGGYGSSRVRV